MSNSPDFSGNQQRARTSLLNFPHYFLSINCCNYDNKLDTPRGCYPRSEPPRRNISKYHFPRSRLLPKTNWIWLSRWQLNPIKMEGYIDGLEPLPSCDAHITGSSFIGDSDRDDNIIYEVFLDHGWDINSMGSGQRDLRFVHHSGI